MGSGQHTRRGWRALTAALALAILPGLGQAGCSADTAELRGAWGQARFSVEIADDPDERARGLMHRKALAASAGMLFVYDAPREVQIWMRNTLIPLDILFIDATGQVQRIHHQAVPLDETLIPSGGPVQAVLEIKGGMAAALGITEGSQLRHPALTGGALVWRCD